MIADKFLLCRKISFFISRAVHKLLQHFLQFAAIVLISTSESISKAKSCDLEKALTSISINYNPLCKYHAIKDDSSTLCYLGIALLAVNFIFFLLILIFPFLPGTCKVLLRTFVSKFHFRFCILQCKFISRERFIL